ncbi:hypothetical protein LSAT2_014887 [Lamellibrachia satsuma]|nr:hypothetical protein LSAT2_014887 [Lamellibrachia satsuma]
MNQWTALLIACVVFAYQLQYSEAQFSFSIPGSWGNGRKRSSARLLEWPAARERVDDDCSAFNADFIVNIYKLIRSTRCRRHPPWMRERTLTAETDRRVEAFEMKYFKRQITLHFLHRTQTNETISELAGWKARVIGVICETTQALLVWSRHSVQRHLKNNLQYTRDDNLQDTREDNLPDTREDNLLDTREDNLQDTREDNLQDTREDNLQDTREDNMQDTREDNLQDTREDNLPDTREENLPDTREENLLDTREDNLQDTREDKGRQIGWDIGVGYRGGVPGWGTGVGTGVGYRGGVPGVGYQGGVPGWVRSRPNSGMHEKGFINEKAIAGRRDPFLRDALTRTL